MRVMIVDKNASAFQLLGYMDAQPGMVSTAGNVIKSVNGHACQVEIEGRLYRKLEVCIDRAVAVAHGWEPPPVVKPKPSKRARNALARNAESAKPTGNKKVVRSSKVRST